MPFYNPLYTYTPIESSVWPIIEVEPLNVSQQPPIVPYLPSTILPIQAHAFTL